MFPSIACNRLFRQHFTWNMEHKAKAAFSNRDKGLCLYSVSASPIPALVLLLCEGKLFYGKNACVKEPQI